MAIRVIHAVPTQVTRLVVATPFARALAIDIVQERIIVSTWVAARFATSHRAATRRSALARETVRQLDAYLRRKLAVFDLPLDLAGTAFERAVWEAVATIPFGVRVPYADVARAIDRPGAQRAVARAMSKTPLDLFIPAHRVIGADGTIKGAGSGSMRRRLLAFESNASRVRRR